MQLCDAADGPKVPSCTNSCLTWGCKTLRDLEAGKRNKKHRLLKGEETFLPRKMKVNWLEERENGLHGPQEKHEMFSNRRRASKSGKDTDPSSKEYPKLMRKLRNPRQEKEYLVVFSGAASSGAG